MPGRRVDLVNCNETITRERLGRMALEDVETAQKRGYVHDDDFTWYVCLWRNSAPRISDLYRKHDGHDPICNDATT